MSATKVEGRPLLYYELTLCCPFCPGRPFTCRLVAKVEPPPDAPTFRVNRTQIDCNGTFR